MLALVSETIDEEWGAELRARDEMLAFGGTGNYVRRHATVQCYYCELRGPDARTSPLARASDPQLVHA
jgi:hypothetical protein